MPTPVTGLPVGNVAVSGSDITVSRLLQSPRIIDRRLGEAINFRYFADRILPNVGSNPGAVIFENWDPRYDILDRKPEELPADGEVPLAGSQEGDIQMVRATPEGLGYVVTNMQERRNQRFVVDRKERGLANNMADRFNAMAIAVINAAISAASRTSAVPTAWGSIVTSGSAPTEKDEWPHSTIALVNAQQDQARVPFKFDLMIGHPLDVWQACAIYDVATPAALAAKLGLAEIIVDNTGDIAQHAPVLVSRGNAGGTSWEQPLQTQVIPEPRRRRKVVQAEGSVAYFVDNAYALLKLTGV